MRIDVLTLFPEMFQSVLGSSILRRASETVADPKDPQVLRPPVVRYHLHDIRTYSTDRHQKVDRPPFGGGPGMVLQCQPIWDAVQAVDAADPKPATRILLTPQGEPLNQGIVEDLAGEGRLLIIAGHYEGIDERVIQKLAPIREISIGDYVLSGGELPAMVLIDAVVRLIPGALGDAQSTRDESFSGSWGGKLDYPQYTRPASWMGLEVPAVLLSGDHQAIETWRREQAAQRTARRRPDLHTPRDGPPAPIPDSDPEAD